MLSFALWLTILAAFSWLAATVVVNVAAPPACRVGAEEDIGCARGFETRERAGGQPFRWTDGLARVELHAAGYGAPLLAELRLAAPRDPGDPSARAILASGALQVPLNVPPTPRRYLLPLPATPLQGDVAALTVASDTWRPARDRRSLGVQVSDVRLRAIGGPRIPGPLHVLALLALGLAAATLAPRRIAWPLGALAVALAAALWAAAPARAAPFLPGLALILAAAALALPRLRDHRPPTTDHRPPVDAGSQRSFATRPWPLAAAILAGAAIEAGFAAGLLRGPWASAGVIAQAAVTLAAVWWCGRAPLALRALLGVALAVRLLGFAARLLAGGAGSDPDAELFYSYGRATIELGLPVAEYPSGALAAWALLALPASRELFALLLPLLNTACDLMIVWALHRITERARGPADASDSAPSALSLFYALSPLLLPFWYGKADSLPAALLALGLAAFLAGRMGASGALIGLGGAVKWAPWLAGPFLALHALREALSATERTEDTEGIRRSGSAPGQDTSAAGAPQSTAAHLSVGSAASVAGLLRLAAGAALAVAAASVPLALRDPAAFLAPYTLQGGRPIIGESVWFLPAYLLDPSVIEQLTHPWSDLDSSPVPPALAVAVQLAALAALGIIALMRPPDMRRTLALAALAPAAFLLLNRVFSPQYMVVITAAALIAGAALLRGRASLTLIALLTVAQAGNLLVWPHTSRHWPLASAALFAAAIGALIWLAMRAARMDAHRPTRPPGRSSAPRSERR